MRLIVTEKNNSARKIAEILSGGEAKSEKTYKVPYYTWSHGEGEQLAIGLKGHVMNPAFPEGYSNWQETDPKTLIDAELVKEPTDKNVLRALRKVAKDAEAVVIATDFDREGELIGLEALEEVLDVTPALDGKVKRARYSALTKEEIERAFSELDDLSYELAHAGAARQDIDLIWGATLTRAVSLATRRFGSNFLSVGRVQSPALGLVVERELERRAHVAKPYWEVFARFQHPDGAFEAHHAEDRFWARDEAEAAIAGTRSPGVVRELGSKRATRRPPTPFNTTAFTAEASSRLGITPSRAMRLAEDLYMDGFISYPRTDNTVYPRSLPARELVSSLVRVPEFDAASFLLEGELKPTRGRKESTDHPPIHPTQALRPGALDGPKRRVYELIARRFLATFAPPMVTESTRADIEAGSESYFVRGSVVVDPGYAAIYTYARSSDEEIPKLEQGQELELEGDPWIVDKETQPPARISQGKLVELMEERGLGTKATRPDIIQKLYDRGYVHGNPPAPTETGIAMYEAFRKYVPHMATPEMTAELERDMDEIATGKTPKDEVLRISREMLHGTYDAVDRSREDLAKVIWKGMDEDRILGPCKVCEEAGRRQEDGSPNMLRVIRARKSGKRFVGCQGWAPDDPDACDQTFPLPQRGDIFKLEERCSICGETPRLKVVPARGRRWNLCLNDDCPSMAEMRKRREEREAARSGAAEEANGGDGARSSPVARRIAADRGIDLSRVRGTGVGGKVTKADVLAAAEQSPAAAGDGAAAAAEAAEEVPLRGPAGMLAEAMNESREMPTATSLRTLPVDTLDAKRKALNAVLADRGTKVSFTHLVAWAIVKAVGEWPAMARTYAERDGKPHLVDAGQVNLGIAVDVERKGARSLMVPCIKGADRLDFKGFHSYYEDLITKTRESKLTADDFAGTNITLTNPGGLGTVASVPRLMKGQSAIVATGSIAYPVEWSHAPPEKIKALGVSKVMTMTSTYDHRIIQGAESGSFLRRIDQLLQGEDSFYESVARDLEIDPGVVARAHPASASAPPLAAALSAEPAVAEAKPAVTRPDTELLQGVQAATSLLKAYRTHGHLAARLDPLGSEPKGDPAIEPENLNLTPELMAEIPGSILRIGVEGETLLDALPRMREAYCGTTGYQIEHLSSHQQRMWLRDAIECGEYRQPLSDEEKRALLGRLIDVMQFERFLQRTYLGQKMFSIEGLDAIVPMIDELATIAHRDGAHEVVIGMAHRGRLSVLAHNLGRTAESIMAEFEGAQAIEAVKAVAAIPHGGTGDVKYHHGHEGLLETGAEGEEKQITMRLYPNPSHLEYVDPVVTGGARAEQSERDGATLRHDPNAAVPVLLHGDAAFPGQGVVAETLNLQSLDGYATGGTVHIIQNNQIGFTTDPEEGRSTPYAADMAKGFNVPIVHVNADDVEACIGAIRLAMAYRERWHRDIVIDLIGYRRYGHNETDEPAYTQPKMAATIKEHRPVSELYAERLIADGAVSAEDAEGEAKRRRDQLSAVHKELKRKIEAGEYEDPSSTGIGTAELDRTKSPDVETAVDEERLRKLNEELLRVPESFTIHRKLRKPLFRRLEILDEGPIEFGHAEALAFASLLTDGTPIRLTGQDTERGTFSHRHLVLHDEKTGLAYTPIEHLAEAKAPFELYNSPLSEAACMGFEYGYSAASPDSLVLWEAQFGDFANSGQVIVDSFIVSGESKWGQRTRLTLLLPHGYEGSGPEHSSARIERFIALAAEGNIRIANPTTAAQYFHLLRRQALIAKPRPLVVFTPKGLLRLPAAASKLSELTDGAFEFVLDDPRAAGRREEITRLVLCSGKLYYDIDGHERRESASSVAIARVELLYPFARNELERLIASYTNLKEIVWAQEEPQNMGAWKVTFRRMPELVPEGVEFRYVGRPERASPGEGYPAAHRSEQERIVLTALTG